MAVGFRHKEIKKMRDFRKYEVWQLSYDFCLSIYKISAKFPKEEAYGLVSQIRRASISIATNISEGCGREGDKEFAAFLNIALGSANEAENLLLLANGLQYIENEKSDGLLEQLNLIKKKIFLLRQKLINKPA